MGNEAVLMIKVQWWMFDVLSGIGRYSSIHYFQKKQISEKQE